MGSHGSFCVCVCFIFFLNIMSLVYIFVHPLDRVCEAQRVRRMLDSDTESVYRRAREIKTLLGRAETRALISRELSGTHTQHTPAT